MKKQLVSEHWVIDASPLILLSRIDQLDLLTQLTSTLQIPKTVVQEIDAGVAKDAAAKTAVTWAISRQVADIPVPISVADWGLGAGETQVIARCIDTGQVTVLDDLAGRRAASSHGIPVIGTLGIALRAKHDELITELGVLIEQLRTAGLYMDDMLVKQVLVAVGEE